MNKGKLIMTKVYSVDEIRANLKTKDAWLIRGILAIYARQTTDEKSSQTTKYTNGMGFNGRDAAILSSFAKQILSWQATENPRFRQPLSEKQFNLARRMMPKYAGQLAKIAEQNNPVEDGQDDYDVNERAAIMSVEAMADRIAEKNEYAEIERQQELEAFSSEVMW